MLKYYLSKVFCIDKSKFRFLKFEDFNKATTRAKRKPVDLDFSYRYRNSFDESKNFQTNRYGIEAIYKFNDSNSLGLRYAQTYGDSESNSWRLQYTHSF